MSVDVDVVQAMIKDKTRRLREQVFYGSIVDDVVIDVDLDVDDQRQDKASE